MKVIISYIIISIIISVISSFSITNIIKNVNKAASVAIVSGLIAVSPAHAENFIFAVPISKLILADQGFSTMYPKGTYLLYDCPGKNARSMVFIQRFKPEKIITTPMQCLTDEITIIPDILAPFLFTVDATKYGSKFSIDYKPAEQVVVVSAQKSFVK
mmetsp:Transcript_6232/g.5568  ORF Transcript_6232/g.5568 Transcript_6232/m.5568 type:complete len:158 (+) Transcript_6232:103-576(+)